MPWRPSASDQVAGERDLTDGGGRLALLELERSAGSLSTARPSAIAPDDTTSTSRLPPCNSATSAASEASQLSLTRPASASTSSDEPTLTTMRRN